jgi:hypothetical protein
LLGVNGRMLIQFLLQRNNVEKNSKRDLVLVMGSSQIISLLRKLTYLFYCEELMVKALGHVSKSSSCVPKSDANGSTCHPFIGGQNHGIIGDAIFGFLCYNFF